MEKSKLDVSIVIPNHNGEELLKQNLRFIVEAGDNRSNRIKEIIIVDDGSTDGSVKYVQKYFPQVKLIKHKTNRGFSSAVNTGARTSSSSFITLLNTDIIPQVDFLESIFPHFNDKNVFAVSLNEQQYSWAKGEFEKGFVGHKPGKGKSKVHDTFWVSGGSGVFRRDIWMKLKGLDEKLFSPFYWEDVDICYRALKRGYRLLWEPKAIVDHKHESSIGRLNQRYVARIRERNQLIFIWKNITSPNLFRKHLKGLVRRILRSPGYLKIVILALFKIRQIIRARKTEKKDGKVSDEAIFARF